MSNYAAILEQQQHRLVDIAYVGPKNIKRETITGKGFVFKRMMPTPVPLEYAGRLLSFEKVFVEADSLEEVKKAEELKAKKAEELKKQREEEAKRKAEEACMVVNIPQAGGGVMEVDLNKYSAPKLATLVESLELKVTPQQTGEPVPEFRTRVRDAIRGLDKE